MGNKKVELRNGGGDDHIAPCSETTQLRDFLENRNNPQRADVGIGPYGKIFRQHQKTSAPLWVLTFLLENEYQ